MYISKISYMRYVNTYEASFKFLRSMSSLNVIMRKGFVKGDFHLIASNKLVAWWDWTGV